MIRRGSKERVEYNKSVKREGQNNGIQQEQLWSIRGGKWSTAVEREVRGRITEHSKRNPTHDVGGRGRGDVFRVPAAGRVAVGRCDP